MNYVEPIEHRIVSPYDAEYELPISILDRRRVTPFDEEIISHMAMTVPRSKFRAGDIVYLRDVPLHLKHRYTQLPRMWKVRFILSAYSFELLRAATELGGNVGLDRCVSLVEGQRCFGERCFGERFFHRPVLYLYGYPQGEHPNMAAFLPEKLLGKTMFREPNETWGTIISEAGADYLGYSVEHTALPFCLSTAPDLYTNGQNIGHPFRHEEPVTETLYLNGFEEMLNVPIIIGSRRRVSIPDQVLEAEAAQ